MGLGHFYDLRQTQLGAAITVFNQLGFWLDFLRWVLGFKNRGIDKSIFFSLGGSKLGRAPIFFVLFLVLKLPILEVSLLTLNKRKYVIFCGRNITK